MHGTRAGGSNVRVVQRVIERILNLLAFLLTAGRPVTAEEIRTTVAGYDQAADGAFHRMFERDKDLLRGLGIPLELTFEKAGTAEVVLEAAAIGAQSPPGKPAGAGDAAGSHSGVAGSRSGRNAAGSRSN